MFVPFNLKHLSTKSFSAMLILAFLLIVGCGGGNPKNVSNIKPPESQVVFSAYQNGDETVVLAPNGSAGLDILKETAKKSAIDSSTIAFETTETNNTPYSALYRIGKYYYDFRWEKHPVYGCINRDVRHINLHLKDTTTEREIVNFHLCVWWDNGPQFGIYNSANGACAKTPGKFSKIREKIQEYLSRMTPLPSWVYVPVAYTAAVVLVTAFALSWA